MRRSKCFILGLFCTAAILTAHFRVSAQESSKLALEDIYKNNIYQSKGYGPVRWMKDNEGYSTLEANNRYGGYDIVRYSATSGNRSVLVSAAQLIPAGSSKPLSVENYEWSGDNNRLWIFTNTRRVWRYNTQGDYWVLNLKTGKLRQLGKTVERSSMMFAKFAPDGSRIAYVSNQNIFVEDLNTGNITQITHDGGGHIINGTFDWAYEEELDDRDGFRWSPDSRYIAYWQLDTKNVRLFDLIDNVDSLYPFLYKRIPYPLVGSENSSAKIGVAAAAGGPTRWFSIPGDPSNHYLARMDFVPHSGEVMIQQLNRKQDTNRVWLGDILSMSLKNILTETDTDFLDVYDNIRWCDKEQYFTWTSERDGWRHLYKVSRDGKKMQLITKGNFDIVKINCIDPESGYVYYIASPDNYTQRYLYRSNMNGGGAPERITPADMRGQSNYQISENGKWAIQTFQNTTTPPVISLVNLPDNQLIRILEDNHALKSRNASLGLTPKEFLRVDIGDATLDAWMIKPPHFDPAKKYPLLFYVYGEPAASTVQDDWEGGDFWDQYMAQQGYVVMSIDNRGTNTPRGKAWRNSIYGQVGILASTDQAQAARKIFGTYPFIDTSRVGIWGWSGGGQMTLNCLFRHSDIYKTGLAVSFVSDQRLYDDLYQERYMGLLTGNARGYHDGSPINFAQNLRGTLMIIHGTGDDNVHYQSFERLVDELIKDNKLFYMMSYPMRSHGIFEGENTSLHLRRTMEKFWKDHL
jgi:dipeptidyl-peptidase-4